MDQTKARLVGAVIVTGSGNSFTHTAIAVVDGQPTTILERRQTPDIDYTMIDRAAAQGQWPARSTDAVARPARAVGRSRPRERRSPRSTRAGPGCDEGGDPPRLVCEFARAEGES